MFRKEFRLKATYKRFLSLSSLSIVIFTWWIIAHNEWVSPVFLPHPLQVWKTFVDILQEGYKGHSLLSHMGDSLFRLGIAFLLALLTAVPLGIVSGCSSIVKALLNPFIEFYRPLPPLAYYTLLVLWLGIGDSSKIALLYLAAFPPLYISTMAGVQRVPQDRIQGALSLGATRWKLFIHVILPSSLPEIFTGIRTSIGFMYTTLVAAEMVASVSGIGWMVLDASRYLRSDVIFVGIIIMGLIAIIIDAAVRWLERKQIPWNGKN